MAPAPRRFWRPMGRPFASALLAAALLAAGCAGSKRAPSSHAGAKILTAVVTERQYDAPGSSSGGSYAGTGGYYLSFEAQEGDRTVHYRFPVTRQQYFRYPEGSRVRLVLLDDRLREIRPKTD
jgi:hypothetical protein